MDTYILERKFAAMGARLKLDQSRGFGGVQINIGHDRRGEFFDVKVNPETVEDLDALDVQPNMRHLLLMARVKQFSTNVRRNWRRAAVIVTSLPSKPVPVEKQKFLCGHDERHWFVAAVPERGSASTVRTAMEALKPPAVKAAQHLAKLDAAQANRRKNRAFVRQGEWFFLPRPKLVVDAALVLRQEPIRRGAGKPHWAEEAYRVGGERVWVSSEYPNGVNFASYQRIVRESPQKAKEFRQMVRNPQLFVRGRIKHPDHDTIKLWCWHEVLMNTETEAKAMQHVAFLD